MMPDPQCASCHGTFIEKLDNPEDDPRQFHDAAAAPHLDDEDEVWPFPPFSSLLPLLANDPGRNQSPPHNRSGSPTTTTTSRSVRFEFGGPNGRRTVILGGPNVLNRHDSETGPSSSTGTSNVPNAPPRLSEFLRANSGRADGSGPDNTRIPGDLMAQYLMALLGGGIGGMRGLSPFFGPLGGDGLGPESGRMGDYVFTQEALDQIMTQLMEGGDSTRPVPATQEIMDELPRTVLEEGSPLLEKDCAVCKEQFSAKAEEPDEQVVVTLPCSHPFHEGCILPWLKSSGTCPVCRHALIPQPNAHPGGPSGSSSPPPNNSNNSGSNRPGSSGGSPGSGSPGSNSRSGNTNVSGSGLFGNNLLGSILGFVPHSHGGSSAEHRPRGSSPSRSPRSPHSPTRNRRSSRDTPPGAWRD